MMRSSCFPGRQNTSRKGSTLKRNLQVEEGRGGGTQNGRVAFRERAAIHCVPIHLKVYECASKGYYPDTCINSLSPFS